MARAALSPAAVRGSQQASPSSLVVSRGQQSSAAVSPNSPSSGGKTVTKNSGGRLNNAAEFALAKVDELVNWARKVWYMLYFEHVST